ncbi:MAG TPA: histidine phosphatase family protein [Firmicutes bacterium]|nr:histidine phosphatase family protein [Bacillota bacterium]
MKLLFIRHAEPDYSIDSLTEKGFREAGLLADWLEKIPVRDFFVSPLGRARDTARPTLERLGRQAEVLDWLQEFYVPVKDPDTGDDRIPWDFMPGYWTRQPLLYDKDRWMDSDIMQTGEIRKRYQAVCKGIDGLLARYGYIREGNFYRTEKGNTDTLAFFCHLGAEFTILSHLLGIAPPCLWQGFFVAPSSWTLLCTEERVKGEAYFRCRTLGNTLHLGMAGEPDSDMGFFTEVF